MPRGLILVRGDGPWRVIRAELARIQADVDFVRQTGAIIESWVATMGASDLGVVVYAVSLESVRSASAKIRDRLAVACKNSLVMTNTVVGSTVREQLEPLEWSGAAISRRLKDLQTGKNASEARTKEAIRCFLIEQLDSLSGHLAAWEKARLLTEPERALLKAVVAYSDSATAGLQPSAKLATLAAKVV